MTDKPKVKLLTLWVFDYDDAQKPDKGIASHGIWETCAVDIDNKNGNPFRVYTLRCWKPYTEFWKIGDTVKMYEEVICAVMTPIEIVKKEKLPLEK